MVGLSRRLLQRRQDFFVLEAGKVSEDLGATVAGGEQLEDVGDAHAQAAETGSPLKI